MFHFVNFEESKGFENNLIVKDLFVECVQQRINFRC